MYSKTNLCSVVRFNMHVGLSCCIHLHWKFPRRLFVSPRRGFFFSRLLRQSGKTPRMERFWQKLACPRFGKCALFTMFRLLLCQRLEPIENRRYLEIHCDRPNRQSIKKHVVLSKSLSPMRIFVTNRMNVSGQKETTDSLDEYKIRKLALSAKRDIGYPCDGYPCDEAYK